MDKHIRAAAGENVHNYKEKDWKNMESLLDTHLPQEKRRRRVIFILFFSLIGLGLAGYLLTYQFSSSQKRVVEQKNIPAPATSNKAVPANTPAENTIINNSSTTPTPDKSAVISSPSTVDKAMTETFHPLNNKPVFPRQTAPNNAPFQEIAIASAPTTASPEKTITIPGKNNNVEKENNIAVFNPAIDLPINNTMQKNDDSPIKTPLNALNNSNATTNTPTTGNIEKTDSSTTKAISETEQDKKETPVKKQGSKLGISVSYGPGISSVGLTKPGQLTSQFGLGLSYAISEKWTVRTGFFASRKLYSADSTNYHLASNTVIYSYKLHEVDANCFVYEIPVSVIYNFSSSKRHNWFVSAGLSSYLMNKEKYEYTYKNPAGQTHSYNYNYKNANSHLFSIVNLSGGYRYRVTDKFSLLAEPFIKAPIGGVGEGRVKLNSAGILFTATFNPRR